MGRCTPREAYEALIARSRETSRISAALMLLSWDQHAMMPPAGAAWRAEVVAALSTIENERLIDPEVARLLDAAEGGADFDPVEKANLRLARRALDRKTRLPPGHAARESAAFSTGMAAWQQAKALSSFALLAADLERVVDLCREKAACWCPDAVHPLDPLLDDNVEGLTVRTCDRLFEELVPAVVPIVKALGKRPPVGRPWPAGQVFARARQEELVTRMTATVGYDHSAGRLACAAHPFSQRIGPGDVRICTRFDEAEPTMPGILAALHETGHGIYSQHLPPQHHGTPVGSPPGPDVDEAISRFYENHVAKTLSFWRHFAGPFRQAFSLDDPWGTPEALHAWVNRPNVTPVRILSDEASYLLHIVIRYELERDLIGGRLPVADLPGAWAARYRDYLGLEPADDREGVLQDIHWSGGYFGYFPSYAIGSIIAAQLDEALRRDVPDLDARYEAGDFAPPVQWLSQHIFRHGASRPAADLVRDATGAEPGSGALVRYLRRKYGMSRA